MDDLRQLLIEDRHVTNQQIRTTLDIGMSRVQTIMHKELCVKKLVSRFVAVISNDSMKDHHLLLTASSYSGDESWIHS